MTNEPFDEDWVGDFSAPTTPTPRPVRNSAPVVEEPTFQAVEEDDSPLPKAVTSYFRNRGKKETVAKGRTVATEEQGSNVGLWSKFMMASSIGLLVICFMVVNTERRATKECWESGPQPTAPQPSPSPSPSISPLPSVIPSPAPQRIPQGGLEDAFI